MFIAHISKLAVSLIDCNKTKMKSDALTPQTEYFKLFINLQ